MRLSNFFGYGGVSKLILIFDMLAGRLELFPMLILFYPSTWKKEDKAVLPGRKEDFIGEGTAGAEGKRKMVTIHRVSKKQRKTE